MSGKILIYKGNDVKEEIIAEELTDDNVRIVFESKTGLKASSIVKMKDGNYFVNYENCEPAFQVKKKKDKK